MSRTQNQTDRYRIRVDITYRGDEDRHGQTMHAYDVDVTNPATGQTMETDFWTGTGWTDSTGRRKPPSPSDILECLISDHDLADELGPNADGFDLAEYFGETPTREHQATAEKLRENADDLARVLAGTGWDDYEQTDPDGAGPEAVAHWLTRKLDA